MQINEKTLEFSNDKTGKSLIKERYKITHEVNNLFLYREAHFMHP